MHAEHTLTDKIKHETLSGRIRVGEALHHATKQLKSCDELQVRLNRAMRREQIRAH